MSTGKVMVVDGHPGWDLPYKGFPTGWFQIAWSHELGPGDVVPLRYFDQELVCFRRMSGELTVFDAYCAHLGAHLGHGGCVEGEELRCPFHGWKWNAEGHNTEIPYSDHTNRAARVRTWHVRDIDGLVLVWYSADGSEPTWEPEPVPEFSDPDFYPLVPHGVRHIWQRVNFQPQHVIENSADAAHLKYVHKNAEVPTVDRHEPMGHLFHFTFGTTYLTPDAGEVPGALPGTWRGPGVLTFMLQGVHDAVEYVTVTPIDYTCSDLRISVVARRTEGDDEPQGMALRIMKHQIKEIERDLPIWQHMRYNPKPPLATEEGKAFTVLRRWTDQFYPA